MTVKDHAHLHVHFSGACLPAPGGTPVFGWRIFRPETGGGRVLQEAHGRVDLPAEKRTKKQASMHGLLDALEWLEENGHAAKRTSLFSDDWQLLKIVGHQWTVKAGYRAAVGDIRRILAERGGAVLARISRGEYAGFQSFFEAATGEAIETS